MDIIIIMYLSWRRFCWQATAWPVRRHDGAARLQPAYGARAETRGAARQLTWSADTPARQPESAPSARAPPRAPAASRSPPPSSRLQQTKKTSVIYFIEL